ncbi:uncharacterized protein B0P05DRAFT_213021 [Gilbertella persicaria]|uniref:uncharacterized protein n=1 Tax=Gilbertella persicaria TaxID=101096 RepID=UPI00221E7321|nr:uncharacterized protein B0P05DRAFT_213021 [Gilbertella persicaria]KAI8066310.1 hypothetical protein B0P05DRAFT_213021 [Gilbertella persicaria]
MLRKSRIFFILLYSTYHTMLSLYYIKLRKKKDMISFYRKHLFLFLPYNKQLMVDTSTSHGFLTRRHSTGDGNLNNTMILPPYPPTIPNHICREFSTPEGNYTLKHSVFIHSMQPLYSVGTTASLVSIKYKETVTTQRYEPQPGARGFRRMFSHGLPEPDEAHKPTDEMGELPTLSFLSRNNKHPRKLKTSSSKTNSSFVQCIITNEHLAKILMSRTSDDINLFYNCGTNFIWVDAAGHPKEPLSRIVFAKACPTSHDVNVLTRGADQLDIIIGFTTGDIVWFDPLSNKYGRINKGVRG